MASPQRGAQARAIGRKEGVLLGYERMRDGMLEELQAIQDRDRMMGETTSLEDVSKALEAASFKVEAFWS